MNKWEGWLALVWLEKIKFESAYSRQIDVINAIGIVVEQTFTHGVLW